MAEKGYDEKNFRMHPCAVEFDGELLGGTDGPVELTRETEYYESTCNQAAGLVLAKRITKIKYTVKAKFKEITVVMSKLLETGKKTTVAEIGKDIYTNGALLRLSEIGGTLVHEFPKAVLLPEFSYAINGVEEHGVELTFEAVSDTADGTIYEQKTATAG